MTAFVPGKTVRSRTPTVSVDPIPAGRWQFTLVVVDDENNLSAPTTLNLDVIQRRVPPLKAPNSLDKPAPKSRLKTPIRGIRGVRPDSLEPAAHHRRPIRPIRPIR